MKCKFNPNERLRPNYFTRQRKLKEENSLTLRTGFTSFSRRKKNRRTLLRKCLDCHHESGDASSWTGNSYASKTEW